MIEHKDRLTRFQFNFIQKMYAVFGCEIIVLDDKDDVSDAEELTRDLMALLASFSGKYYYGRRSLERRRQNKYDTSKQTKGGRIKNGHLIFFHTFQ